MTKAAIYIGYTFVFCITLSYVNFQNKNVELIQTEIPQESIASIQFLEPVKANKILIKNEKIILEDNNADYYDEIRYDEFL